MLSLNDSKIGLVVRVCGSWLRRSLAAGLMLIPPLAHPQISSPDSDPHDQPFSYPSQPNDEIGGMADRPRMPQNGALVQFLLLRKLFEHLHLAGGEVERHRSLVVHPRIIHTF